MISSLPSYIAALPKRGNIEPRPTCETPEWYEFEMIQRELENDALLIVKHMKGIRRNNEWVIGTKLSEDPIEMLRELGTNFHKMAEKLDEEKINKFNAG